MKTKKEQEFEFERLDKLKQDGYTMLIDSGASHEFAMQAVRKYKLYDIERIIAMGEKGNLTLTQAFILNLQIQELTTEQRKVYFSIVDKFCTEPGDEYLALLMVKDYCPENLGEIVAQHNSGSMTIDVFAMEQVKGRCRFPIDEVEADPELEEEAELFDKIPF